MSYIIPVCYLEFAISACYFHLLSLIYIEVWSVEAFKKTSEREAKKLPGSLNDSLCCLCSMQLNYMPIQFSSSIFSPSYININDYPLSLKVSKKAFRYIFQLSVLTYYLPSQEFKYFSWNFRIVKKLKTG